MIGVQLVALAVGLAALHLTYLYYKRAHFSKLELIFWAALWSAFVCSAVFPSALAPVVGYLGLTRSMDLIMIIAFIALFSLAFHSYIATRSHARAIEALIRDGALRNSERDNEQ